MGRLRLPLVAVAIVLLALIALLATLQYQWLGQIGRAERDRMRATLGNGAAAFAQDFDRELTRAYLLFQMNPSGDQALADRMAERYDQWQATARFPGLLDEIYSFAIEANGDGILRRLDPQTGALTQTDWPSSMANWRDHLASREVVSDADDVRTVLLGHLAPAIWEEVPAIVAPMPSPILELPQPRTERVDVMFGRESRLLPISYAILTLDRDCIRDEILPALAGQHFGHGPGLLDYQVAVVRAGESGEIVYASTPDFSPSAGAAVDASADFFQVRPRDFGAVAAEVRRFATALQRFPREGSTGEAGSRTNVLAFRESAPLSIAVSAFRRPNRRGSSSRSTAPRRPWPRRSTAPVSA